MLISGTLLDCYIELVEHYSPFSVSLPLQYGDWSANKYQCYRNYPCNEAQLSSKRKSCLISVMLITITQNPYHLYFFHWKYSCKNESICLDFFRIFWVTSLKQDISVCSDDPIQQWFSFLYDKSFLYAQNRVYICTYSKLIFKLGSNNTYSTDISYLWYMRTTDTIRYFAV